MTIIFYYIFWYYIVRTDHYNLMFLKTDTLNLWNID